MKQVLVSEVHDVSVHAKKVYELAVSAEIREEPGLHDKLTLEVDALLASWEKLFDRLHHLSVEAARMGRVLAVEDLELRGVFGDIRAARTALDSATRSCQWKYPGYSRNRRSEEPSDSMIVGLQTLRKDFNEFLEQLARAAKIMHDHREVLRAPGEIAVVETASWRWVDSDIVFDSHRRQIEEHGGVGEIRDHGLIESALARPINLAHYETPDAARLAAAYAFGIARNHGFVDGNKRTAFIAACLFLDHNEIDFDVQPVEAVTVMNDVASSRMGAYTDNLTAFAAAPFCRITPSANPTYEGLPASGRSD